MKHFIEFIIDTDKENKEEKEFGVTEEQAQKILDLFDSTQDTLKNKVTFMQRLCQK